MEVIAPYPHTHSIFGRHSVTTSLRQQTCFLSGHSNPIHKINSIQFIPIESIPMVVTVRAPSLIKSVKSFDRDRVSEWNVPSVASDVSVVFCREIQFLLRDELPVFPFCQAAADARCRYRWPPWPHRLDRGHPRTAIQVSHFSIIRHS